MASAFARSGKGWRINDFALAMMILLMIVGGVTVINSLARI